MYRTRSQHKTHRRLYQNPHLDTMLTQAVSPSQQLPGELNEPLAASSDAERIMLTNENKRSKLGNKNRKINYIVE